MDKCQVEERQEIQEESTEGEETGTGILFTVEETPPWYLCILFGFQVNN